MQRAEEDFVITSLNEPEFPSIPMRLSFSRHLHNLKEV